MKKIIVLSFIFSFFATNCKQKKAPITTITSTANNNEMDQLAASYIDLKDAFIKEQQPTIDSAISSLQKTSNITIRNSKIKILDTLALNNALTKMQTLVGEIATANTLEAKRRVFKEMADPMTAILKNSSSQTLYVQHCPMAYNDSGAYWISRDGEDKIRNPFLPKTMLRCGEVTDTLEAVK
jgi:membrane fusion protein, copper/silver efflux system